MLFRSNGFDDNEVVIPFQVLEELDRFKKDSSDLGMNVRMAVRRLDKLRQQGRLNEGVQLNSQGGTLRVDIEPGLADHPILQDDIADNRIISSALRLKEAGKDVVFVSKDINARIKSDVLGIRTEDYEKQKVDFERLYTGYREVEVDSSAIENLKGAGGKLDLAADPPWNANEFAVLKVEGREPVLARYDEQAKALVPTLYTSISPMGVGARNIQQQMAFELLLDDRIKLVSLIGMAGTGKTLLAVACGLQKVLKNEGKYEKLLVSRPIMPLGRDIGFLPGSKDEKLAHWMQPIFDNLGFIFSLNRKPSEPVEKSISDLQARGLLELEALAFIRGRSIPRQYMIVDEAQNLTPHEIKTVVTRVGEGTKLVLTGDATQIDNPYLDASSNGLSYSVEQMRGSALVGHVTLARSERSELASMAASRL